MDLASILLILALIIPVAAFVLRPLYSRTAAPLTEAARRTSPLLAERERILSALQELDFDHVVGKIPEEDYPARRAALVAEGAAVLKALDELEKEDGRGKKEKGGRRAGELDAALEAAVSSARRSGADLETALESAVASTRTTPANGRILSPGSYCPQCGKPVQADDKFCARCGHALVPADQPE